MSKKVKLVLLIVFSLLVVLVVVFLYMVFTFNQNFDEVDHYPHLLFCERLKIGMQRNEVEAVLSEFGEYSYFETPDFSNHVVVSITYPESLALLYTFHSIELEFDSREADANLIDVRRLTILGDPLALPECDK